jgi:IclR family transcriptional regulator, KDG regulon repressor
MVTTMRDTQADEAAQASRAVVEKAFTLLEAWSYPSEVLGVSELARRSGLAKSTAYRVLGILDAAALVERVDGGYRIGDRVHGFTAQFGAGYRPDLREVVLPFLQDLYELTHETVHLGVLDGAYVRCVEKLYGHRRNLFDAGVGGLLPVHSTALGKVLLAYSPVHQRRQVLRPVVDRITSTLTAEIPVVLRLGVAFDRRETHPGVTCVAAPILSPAGEAIAAISVSGPAQRFDPAAVVERLRRAARGASLALGRSEVRAA